MYVMDARSALRNARPPVNLIGFPTNYADCLIDAPITYVNRLIGAPITYALRKSLHARLHALRHESEVEELEGDPQLPVGDDGVLPVLLQLRRDVGGLALQESASPGCRWVGAMMTHNNRPPPFPPYRL